MISIVKYIKRLVVNILGDLFPWVKFYWRRTSRADDSLADLNSAGLQVLGDVLTGEDIRLLEAVATSVDLESKLAVKGQARGRLHAHGLLDERIGKTVDKFSLVAKRYLNSESVKLELTYFQLSTPAACKSDVPGGDYHMDDNKPNLKFFVYLNDVGAGNGPFRVVPHTHGLRLNKLSRYLKWSLLKNRSNLYSESDQLAQLDKASVNLVGEKGFCFAADTTAWHRADPVQTGQRLVFVASFNLK